MSNAINIMRANQELDKFLISQQELKGRSVKIDEYNTRRISELKQYINRLTTPTL